MEHLLLCLLDLNDSYADTSSNLSSSRPPLTGYPHDTKKHLLMEKEIVSQCFKLQVWYPDVDVRYHCYPTIRTDTAFDIT